MIKGAVREILNSEQDNIQDSGWMTKDVVKVASSGSVENTPNMMANG
jgi:predicted transcriptional regulator